MSGAKILIVEDEGIEALDLQQRLTRQGYFAPEIASTGEEAIKKTQEMPFDLVLMDIMLQGELDGISAAEQIKAKHGIPVIYTTAYADEETLQRAKLTEPHGYIIKPLRERELCITIDMALYKHRMEKQLKESRQWFATTLKSIGDGVIATDNTGLIIFMNPVAEKLLGWKLEEVSNKRLTEIFRIIDLHMRKPVENPVAKVLREGVTVGPANHSLLITRNGEEIPIDDSAAPIKDDQGNMVGVVLVFRNVKERIQAEEALRQSEERYRLLAEKLREADSRKNDFMAVLSHELRNPLAAIHISLSILKKADPFGEKAKRARDIIERQSRQLSHLVDDLLDITRITRNKIQLRLQRLEFNELVRQTLDDHRPLFEKNGVQLEAYLAPTPIFLNADRARLVQVVGNLLQNSAKFTQSGGYTCVSVESDIIHRQAIIRVADNGAGIAPEMLPHLFQPFMQADITLDRNKSGLGLGLALSKGLVELHGGSITAHSAGKGQGSEFIVSLPQVEGSVEAPSVSHAIAQRRRRIMIIDDNVDMAECFREYLELNGHEVEVAHNGMEGMAKANDFRPDVLLCDIGLPNLNGYEVARAIRGNNVLHNVYLVAITGYALPEDLQRAAAAGFDCHLSKPIDLAKLDQILALNFLLD